MSFLKAEWRKLAIANYAIDKSLLLPYLPYKTELDTWQNIHYLSLVGFKFVNTKMLGIKIPFHVNFEEVNLRFYVKYNEGGNWKRGVVFIKEIVPKLAISLVANTFYGEHYSTRKMRHTWQETKDSRMVEYAWKEKRQWQSIQVTADKEAQAMEEGGETEFITEHYWGYSRVKSKKTFEYEVTHPKWLHYPVQSYQLKIDYGKVYGESFAFLNDLKPTSVMLAEGSEITVENKRKL